MKNEMKVPLKEENKNNKTKYFKFIGNLFTVPFLKLKKYM